MVPAGKCALVLELREPPGSSVTVSLLPDHTQQSRLISLVREHTYHIMCRDDTTPGEAMSWRQNGIPVRVGIRPEVGSEIYSSPDISPSPNEQTLVLQEFGNTAVGVYSCHGVQGDRVSLDIRQSKS